MARTPATTDHGDKRLRERLGLSRKAIARHIEKVYREGLREADMPRADAREVRQRRLRLDDARFPVDYVLYNGDLYCFSMEGSLITVLPGRTRATPTPRRRHKRFYENDTE